MKRIYIAGPMSKGDHAENIRRGLKAGMKVWNRGFLPHVPHLNHFWGMVDPRPDEFWLAMDFEEIKRCDGLLRLKGKSCGADKEVKIAHKLGIPIFYSIKELLDYVWP